MLICNLSLKKFNYEFEKLSRLFLPFERIDVVNEAAEGDRIAVLKAESGKDGVRLTAQLTLCEKTESQSDILSFELSRDEKEIERMLSVCLFNCFVKITGNKPAWGILTGVRPARLFSATVKRLGLSGAKEYFGEKLLVSSEKISLCEETYKTEEDIISLSRKKDASLYISVPFCPSRCSYCSFVSHSVESAAKLIPDYVDALCRELVITAKTVKQTGIKLKTVYMGGGTPTTLTPNQLEKIFNTLKNNFDLSGVTEFTVEAGRPDTVTKEKLEVIKKAGATRISINPQTLNDNVLKMIGRRHTAAEFRQAFLLARECGFNNINTDLIAGLTGDDFESFKNTLLEIIKLSPESVTVHALSVKRASDINLSSSLPKLDSALFAARAVSYARQALSEAGITPYYMYRQSKTVGNLENVGYAKQGFRGLYNVYIMDETHTILGVGASAVTKLKATENDTIKRIFNYKYPYEYINRFEEQIKRKEEIPEFYDKNC